MKWKVELSSFPGLYNVLDEDGNRVVRHATHERATLIASAPDLLAERDALREALQRCIKALQVWRAHLEVNDPTLETPEVIEAIKQARAALGAAEPGREQIYLYFVKDASPLMICAKSELEAMKVRQRAREQGYKEVTEADYKEAVEAYRAEEEA